MTTIKPLWASMVAHAFKPCTQEAKTDKKLCECEDSLAYIASSRPARLQYIKTAETVLIKPKQQQQQNLTYFGPHVTGSGCFCLPLLTEAEDWSCSVWLGRKGAESSNRDFKSKPSKVCCHEKYSIRSCKFLPDKEFSFLLQHSPY